MITGFNTDIEHEGVVYHVQTEDKGLETPLILSLVYVGGAILASKRAPYRDLIEQGFDVKVLTERLQRQHKLICAAIRAGRIEDLKRMSEKETTTAATTTQQTAPPAAPQVATQKASASSVSVVEATAAPPAVESQVPELEIIPGYDLSFTEESYAPQIVQPPPSFEPPPVEEPAPAPAPTPGEAEEEASNELYLTLMDDEGEFRAGQFATIKVYVGRGLYGRHCIAGADVTVKILGTTFRPMIITTRTDENGFAVVRAQLPRFNSGRAAIVIRAVVADEAAELRRIIHQA
ncbi:MAG TPA: hypothetical protein VGV59_08950 [Pyrinomonadaceae bacterium]|nr:hypothetical protein [Pyrinomonadaceae bacterium]